MSHQVKDSQDSSLSQLLLISFLIAASPSKLSQHFHILRGFTAIAIAPPASTGVCSSQQRKGLRMLAQKAAQERGLLGQEIRQIPAWRHPSRRNRGEWGAGRGTELLRALLGRAVPPPPPHWTCSAMALGLKSLKISLCDTAATSLLLKLLAPFFSRWSLACLLVLFNSLLSYSRIRIFQPAPSTEISFLTIFLSLYVEASN